jgi:hypothetical protein
MLSYVGLSKDRISSPDSQTYYSDSVLSLHSLSHVIHQNVYLIIDIHHALRIPAEKAIPTTLWSLDA